MESFLQTCHSRDQIGLVQISGKNPPPPRKKVLWCWILVFHTTLFTLYSQYIFFPLKSVPLSMNKTHFFEIFFSLFPYLLRLLLSRKKKKQKMVIFQTKPKLFSLHCEWSPWPTELSSCLWKSLTFPMLKIQSLFCCLQNLPQGKSLLFLVFWPLSHLEVLLGTEIWNLPKNFKKELEILIKQLF